MPQHPVVNLNIVSCFYADAVDDEQHDDEWPDYYASQAGRAPRALLQTVLQRWDGAATGHEPREAIDLGCGDGADTVELLRRGWRVLAVDQHAAAIDLLRRSVQPTDRDRLITRVADFTDLTRPGADLIYCGWSLPHCPAAQFMTVWKSILTSLRPGGRFAGQLLATRDDWAADPNSSAFQRVDLDSLLAGLNIEDINEVEDDRSSFDGPKHWHYYEVIASRPA